MIAEDDPAEGPVPDDENLDSELIRLAYSAVMDPLAFDGFLAALNRAGQEALRETGDDVDVEGLDGLRQQVERVSGHVRNAEALLQAQSARMLADPGAQRTLRDDSRPAILLADDGTVRRANGAATAQFGLKPGRTLPDDILERSDRKTLNSALKPKTAPARGDVVGRIALRAPEDGEATQFALVPIPGHPGENKTYLRLSALSVPWRPDVAERFRAELGLSDRELDVMEAVVRGEPLRDLADRRERSLGTIRNQLKSIFRKTEVDSQVKLVSLYAAFAELSRQLGPEADPDTLAHRGGLEALILQRPDGTALQVDFAGPAKGRPVLLFHGMIGGHAVTPQMHRILHARRVRLVMPWRAGWAGTMPDASGDISMELAVRDMRQVADHLGLDEAPAIAEAVGGIHALNLARRPTDAGGFRPSGLVWCSANLPVRTAADLRDLAPSTRALTYLVRYTPQLASAFIRLVLRRIDAGHDVEALLSLLGESEDDARILETPEVVEALYGTLPAMKAQALKGPIQDIKTEYSRWSHLDTDPGLPVHLMHGRGQLKPGSDWPEAIARRLASVTSESVASGSLFYFVEFDRVLAALDRIAPPPR